MLIVFAPKWYFGKAFAMGKIANWQSENTPTGKAKIGQLVKRVDITNVNWYNIAVYGKL